MQLNLNGLFRLTDSDGREIALSGRYGPALIAILAISHRHSRSRDALRALLWPRSPDAQSQASLRTLLNAVRKELGPHANQLVADRKAVSLVGVTLAAREGAGNETFFEDAPALGEEFEDWLSIQRSRSRAVVAEEPAAAWTDRRLCVAIYPAEVSTDDLHVHHVVRGIIARMRQHLCLMDMIDVIDLSILDESAVARPVALDQSSPDLALLVSLSKIRSLAEIGIRAFEPATRRVLWSASISADQSTTFLFSSDQIDGFVNQAADSLQTACLRRLEAGLLRRDAAPNTIFGAVHKVLGMSVRGQDAARDFFRDRAEYDNSAVAAAWYAFSLANTLGEGGAREDVAAEAERFCRRAIELDPSNALSLALVAHVQGFVLRRLQLGAELAATAREIAPTLPIAWDLAAMNALYRGDVSEGSRLSARAVSLGRFSPYRPIFESSQAIAASVDGAHDKALRIGKRVLDRIPGFLAVERHMSGSLAALGRHDESRRMAARVRARDARFTLSQIMEPDYPLPSPQSVELIRRGLQSLGSAT